MTPTRSLDIVEFAFYSNVVLNDQSAALGLRDRARHAEGFRSNQAIGVPEPCDRDKEYEDSQGELPL